MQLSPRRALLLLLVAAALLAGLATYRWLSSPGARPAHRPEARHTPAHESAARADFPGKNGTGPDEALPSAPTRDADALEDTIDVLSSHDRDRWIAGAQMLSRLKPSRQWQVLNAPGVADQPVAKALREKIVTGCSVSMSVLRVQREGGTPLGGPSGLQSRPMVLDWCRDLLDTHSVDYYFAQARALGQAHVQFSPEVFVPAFEKDELSASEQQEMDALLIKRLQQADNPLQIQQLVLNLWDLRSKLFAQDWPHVDSLSRFQQQRLQQALAVAVACRASHSCGPMGMSVIHFCALMPGTRCEPGQPLDALLRTNMSQFEYDLLQQMAVRALLVRSR